MQDFLNHVVVPGLTGGAISGLFALAFVVLNRATGVLNFAHGQLVMLMPMGVLVAVDKWGLPVAVGFVLAPLGVLFVALIEERIAVRPFIQSQHALPWLISTFGFSVVLTEVMSIPFRNQPVAFRWRVSPKTFEVGGVGVSWAGIVTVVVFVLLVIAMMWFDRRTVTGLRLRASSQDRLGAAALGISPRSVSRIAALIAAGIAAVTGVLVASTQLVTPNLGLTVLFSGFIAAAVGGLDSIPGTLVGAAIVGVLGQAASTYIGGLYVQAALFSVLLLVYLVRPHGVFGRASVRAV